MSAVTLVDSSQRDGCDDMVTASLCVQTDDAKIKNDILLHCLDIISERPGGFISDFQTNFLHEGVAKFKSTIQNLPLLHFLI